MKYKDYIRALRKEQDLLRRFMEAKRGISKQRERKPHIQESEGTTVKRPSDNC